MAKLIIAGNKSALEKIVAENRIRIRRENLDVCLTDIDEIKVESIDSEDKSESKPNKKFKK